MGINQYIQIGSRIKEARLEKGIKQNKMAELLGISVSTYSNYENNYREPKLDIIHQICEILGIELDELLGLSQFEPEIVDKISDELLKDDIVEVKKRLSLTFHKLFTGDEISQEDKELFQAFTKSPAFQPMLPSAPNVVTVNSEIDTSHPFYLLQEKLKRGEGLTDEEEKQYLFYLHEAEIAFSESLQRLGTAIRTYYELLNENGQKKADEEIERTIKQIEMLTKIPEYQKDNE